VVAVDTNVIVRMITRDDPAQAARAARLFQREEIWVAKTVMLEAEWVLRSLYKFAAIDVVEALKKLSGLPGVHVEDSTNVAQALSWVAAGVDFADGLHLASRGESDRFVSFDDRFATRARKLNLEAAILKSF
jgi:predicted nucleic-acid-binding protein